MAALCSEPSAHRICESREDTRAENCADYGLCADTPPSAPALTCCEPPICHPTATTDTVNLAGLSNAVNVSHEFLAGYVFEHGFGQPVAEIQAAAV